MKLAEVKNQEENEKLKSLIQNAPNNSCQQSYMMGMKIKDGHFFGRLQKYQFWMALIFVVDIVCKWLPQNKSYDVNSRHNIMIKIIPILT